MRSSKYCLASVRQEPSFIERSSMGKNLELVELSNEKERASSKKYREKIDDADSAFKKPFYWPMRESEARVCIKQQ